MESGIVYFLSSVMSRLHLRILFASDTAAQVILIVLMVLRLPRGTLGDIYSPVNQIVAVRPFTSPAGDSLSVRR